MSLYQLIRDRKEKLCVIGLGYVGLPLAIAFAKVADVIGFDISKKKIERYLDGIDVTKEVGDTAIRETRVSFTYDETQIRKTKFHIIAVPTPINIDKTPDLKPVIGASEVVGRNLTKGSIVVYESTVYPGVTEEVCIPILEKESGLKCGIDFKVGYSPERINPGDKVHRLETIVKIVSGMDKESLDDIANIYGMVIKAGVHRAASIKIAEAAKVIENSQRDINIAFMNELSMVFNKMGIDTKSVIEAAATKWNFLNFYPGLVGGHCISVDPYYFIYRAEELGYHSQIVLSGRRINDEMGNYVAENTIKSLICAGKQVKGAKIAIFGISFKENCPDSRNSKVIDIIKKLQEYNVEVKVVDPIAQAEAVLHEYGVQLHELSDIESMDAIIFAVPHEEFRSMTLDDIKKFYKHIEITPIGATQEVAASIEDSCRNETMVLIDVKGMFDKKHAEEIGYLYWRL